MHKPLQLVYSEQETLPLGHHVFHAEKYRGIREKLLRLRAFAQSDFIPSQSCRDEDVLLVHTKLWVEKILKGTLSTREELELEVPYSKDLVKAFWQVTGGTILAARLALQNGCCVHIGGGFHHAFADHGEGFCLINDVAIAIRRMQHDGHIVRAMVIDCDVHHGNGTAGIFGIGGREPFPQATLSQSFPATGRRVAHMKTSPARDVFTISLHQENNYPQWKPPSSIDVNLPDGTPDELYLQWLDTALRNAREHFEPELICYVAGADPYNDDQLGGLALTMEGLKQRDLMVYNFAHELGCPIMTTFAGGYAQNPDDTVAIHTNTVLAAKEVFAPARSHHLT